MRFYILVACMATLVQTIDTTHNMVFDVYRQTLNWLLLSFICFYLYAFVTKFVFCDDFKFNYCEEDI